MNDTLISHKLTPNSFDTALKFDKSNSLKLSHINVRSLSKIFESFKLLFEECICTKFDIIGMSEVWNVTNKSIFSLEGYSLEVNCRPGDSRGGGVGAYINTSLKYTRLEYRVIHAESLWLHIDITDNVKVTVGIIYRKPNTNVKEFQDDLLSVLQEMRVDKHKCVLLGDFNVNSLSEEDTVEEFLTSLQCIGLDQLIQSPTRVTKESATLIDHIYSNINISEIHSGIIQSDVSDHFTVFAIFKNLAKVQSSKKIIQYRCYKKYDINVFREDLAAYNWEMVYNSKDVNTAYLNFCSSFSNLCNKHAPLVTKQLGKKKSAKKPWISRGIMKSIRVKYTMYSKVIKSNHRQDLVDKYKKYRNVLTTLLRNAKRNYYCDLLQNNMKDTNKTWAIINELLAGKNRSPRSTEVDRLIKKVHGENMQLTSQSDIVNGFNDFFVNIGPNLADELPNTDVAYGDFLGQNIEQSLFWKPITAVEIKSQVLLLDTKKACGHDNMPVQLIRDSAPYISHPLAYIFNLSLETGKVPDEIKIAKVTPLHKKGPREDPGNYRPISVLPVIGKVLEKLINIRLIQFLEKNDIFYYHQYGFRKKYSTKLSLINLINSTLKSIDQGKVTLGMFIDFKKAFDTINHNILLGKLSSYGIRGLPLEWVKDYLSNRFQFVQCGQTLSERKKIRCGVPQGSVLGPTLFLIYINDLPTVTDYFNFRLFADDSNLFHTFSADQGEIDVNEVNNNIQKIHKWCTANKLTINSMKTNFMLICSRRKKIGINGKLKIAGEEIKEVDVATFVGVHIDRHLSWKSHIRFVNQCIRKKVGVLFRLRHFVPSRTLILLYKAFIQPHISYGIEVWGSTYKTSLRSILYSQKMAVRAITFSEWRTPSDPLFKRLRILNVYNLHDLSISTFMFDLVNGNLPHILIEYCDIIEHSYSTRQKEDGQLRLPKLRTTQGQFSLSFVGSEFWNRLPVDVRLTRSRNRFRNSVTSHLLNKS